ncbi:MAG: DNA-directed RNA polymerase subunit beta, partial [Culicoidibacterales bacterium]
EVKEQEVFMGDIPLMTDAGTFIINGAERVVVSQLVRSPGVYLAATLDKSGKRGLGATVIPNRGAWLEYETDIKDITHVRIDRTRKLPLTVLLRALGLSSDIQILDLFGDNTFLLNTLEKDQNDTPEGISGTENALLQIYERLRPGEPATIDGATNLFISRFFDDKRYDLARVGRYKFNKKLNVLERLDNRILAEAIISVDGEVLAEAGTRLNRRLIEQLRPEFEAGANVQTVMTNDIDGRTTEVQIVKIYADEKQDRVVNVMGNYNVSEHYITISDILASVNYFYNLLDGVGTYDDIDHLGNRRIRSVGELLQNQFRIGLTRMERVVRERMSIQETEGLTPQSLINVRPVVAVIKEFFGSSQLSQFMDQTNPLAELTHKRRLSALGPGGLTRERAGMEVRDVHYSHYGRMCPIETPEGPNIGLINTLATFARLNEYGFIQTPYRKINHVTLEDGSTQAYVSDEILYVTADEEDHYIVAQANMPKDHTTGLIDPTISEWAGRHRGKNDNYLIKDLDLADVSPKQIVSVATACIPFLEHDDANRALMGANMQRQAVPLLVPEAAYVGTGMEHVAARD